MGNQLYQPVPTGGVQEKNARYFLFFGSQLDPGGQMNQKCAALPTVVSQKKANSDGVAGINVVGQYLTNKQVKP
jgi:hypothetical protein